MYSMYMYVYIFEIKSINFKLYICSTISHTVHVQYRYMYMYMLLYGEMKVNQLAYWAERLIITYSHM